jgi:hypothetical protein
MAEATVKEQVLRAIERLPDNATLDDVAHVLQMYELLARGRADSAAGLGVTTQEARKQLGLTG